MKTYNQQNNSTMKTIKTYIPIALQAALLLTGYFLINAGLASDISMHKTSALETELMADIETEQSIEAWMTDLENWNENRSENPVTTNNSELESLLSEENLHEEELALEEWMLSASNEEWEINTRSVIELEKEEEITLEDWMTDLSQWNK